MDQDIIDSLKEEVQSPLAEALLKHAKAFVKRSRSVMSTMYPDWDHQDQVYRGEAMPDKEDKKNAREAKPIKMVVPNTFAQCMTFTSFLFLMFKQNENFYELKASGDEDAGSKRKDCETLLQRDLDRNQFDLALFQHLLDVSRFGLGILETSWTKQMSHVYVTPEPTETQDPVSGATVSVQASSSWQEFLKYEGNQIRAVSPYRFFPDTTFPVSEFQKGEACAIEEPYSMADLRDMEANGEVSGVDFIQPLPKNLDETRGGPTRIDLAGLDTINFIKGEKFDPSNNGHNALVTKCQMWLVPKKFQVGPDEKDVLGPEGFKILYHVWYANDNRVIRFEPCMNWHNEFGFCQAQFTPDMQRTINLGLADLIYRLQDVISWFINSHISSVRRIMQNRLIVDPRLIDTASLDGEKDIYLRKGVSVPNLEKAVGQVKVQDVTQGHIPDSEFLGKIMEQITGVNGNAMGQYNSGRRSAQEARVVTAGAAGRMKLHAHLIWCSSLGRQGRLMLSNLRQQLSLKSFIWATGTDKDDMPQPMVDPTTQQPMVDPMTGQPQMMPALTGEQKTQNRFILFKGTPEEIVCSDDFAVFDSTLASEKGFVAQSIQELFSVLIQANPMIAAQLGQKLDPSKLLDEMFYLRGSGNVSRFAYDPGQAPPMPQPQVVPGAALQPQQIAQPQAA